MSITLNLVHIILRPTAIYYDLPNYIPTKNSALPKYVLTNYLAKIKKNVMKKINLEKHRRFNLRNYYS